MRSKYYIMKTMNLKEELMKQQKLYKIIPNKQRHRYKTLKKFNI